MFTLFQRIIATLLTVLTIPGSLTGAQSLFGKKTFNITLDENTKAICDTIKENSLLDIEKLVTNLPDVNTPARIIKTVFHLDTVAFRTRMFALRDKYAAEGDNAKALLFYLLGDYFGVFEKCDIVLEQVDENKYEFVLEIYCEDGYSERLYTGTYYNPETGEFFGADDKGISTLGFNFDMDEMLIYATVNAWMRDFGFCFGYDLFCYTTPFFYYHTRRFKFEYAGKDWMIQIWKGKYVVANGAEVGIYNREKGKIGTFYNCAGNEEMCPMSLSLYHEEELLFTRETENHWWANGFQLSKTVYSADELTQKFTIEMKDEEMLKAFCKAIDNELHRDVTYTVEGLTVSVQW